MITAPSLEALKSRIDIVDVVGGYLNLKKSGLNFSACCPFHGEKTASFVVSAKKQIYHCFGCGVSGDAIKFVQEYERISFNEAVEKLATQYGVTLTYDNAKESSDTKALEIFANYFRANIARQTHAKEYLAKRHISEGSIERFHLGWAGSSKEQIEYAKSQHLDINSLIEFGVFAVGDNGLYARFVDRLIFPIKGANGKVIGFGGRTLSNHPAKYINSPATKLFDKSSVLYGFDTAKESISKQHQMILCEGYMDVIALHQTGYTNAVAVLGTALTQKHLPQIKRFNAKVILSFDGDGAGASAAFKSANLLVQNDVLGSVVTWGVGTDPADLIGKKEEINTKLANSESMYHFILRTEMNAFDLSDTQQKQRAVKRLSEVLSSFGDVAANELKGYAAALVGVNGIKVLRPKQSIIKEQQFSINFKEASIIKTAAQSHSLCEYASIRLAPELFRVHQVAYIALMQNDDDNLELLQILSSDSITSLDNELFYDYADSLKRDFSLNAAKFLREFGGDALMLRNIAKECSKSSEIDDEFLEQVLASYNFAKNKV